MNTNKYNGKRGEYLVLSELLRLGIESYPTIFFEQADFDITSILENNKVLRVQVKSTELQDQSKNNVIKNIHVENIDYLIIVAFDNSINITYYVLSKEDVSERLDSENSIYLSEKNEQGAYRVRGKFECYKDKWEKITKCAANLCG